METLTSHRRPAAALAYCALRAHARVNLHVVEAFMLAELLALVHLCVACTSWARGDTYLQNSKQARSSQRESFASLASLANAESDPLSPIDQANTFARMDGQLALVEYKRCHAASQALELLFLLLN